MQNRIFSKRPTISWIVLVVIVSIYLAALNHLSYDEFSRCVGEGTEGAETIKYVLPCLFFLLFVITQTLFSFRYIFKPFLSIMLLLSGFIYYARSKYGVLFNTEMLENFLETDVGEARSYISVWSVSFVVLAGLLPALLIWYPKVRYPEGFAKGLIHRGVIFTVGICAFVGIAMLNYNSIVVTVRNNHHLRYELLPHVAVISAIRIAQDKFNSYTGDHPHQYYAKDAKLISTDKRPTIFVYLLGETARAANYPQNGYSRNTTPYTDEFGDIIFFRDEATCGTSTKVSVPCMFSYKTREKIDHDTVEYEDSLTDFIQNAGIKQAWLENDGGCKGVCNNIKLYKYYIESTVDQGVLDKGQCNEESCFDEVMLPDFEKTLKENSKESLVVYLHLKGSHGPTYFNRMPEKFKKYSPICNTSELAKCSTDEVMNTYDDTLIYTDYIIAEVRKILDRYQDTHNLGMLYVSDHGESLGENGLYLHGTPYYIAPDFQTHVPMQIWLNDNLLDERNLDKGCLLEQAKLTKTHSHDNLFHSMLGILNISSEYYDQKLDLFAPCVKH